MSRTTRATRTTRTTRTTVGIRIVRRTPLTLLVAFTGVSLVGSPLPAQVVSTAEGGRWDDSLTWEGRRLPGPGDDVVIRGPVTHPGSCGSLTIEAGASLVAPSGRGITIGGDVVNRGTVAAGPGARFMVDIGGDLTNEGTWEPTHTRFTEGRHVLSFADGTALGGDVGATGYDVVLELAGPLRLTGRMASSNTRIVFAGSGADGAAAGVARDPARNCIIIVDCRVQTPSPDHLIVLDGGRLDGIPIEGGVTVRGTPDGSGELSGHVKGDLLLEGSVRLGHTRVDGDLVLTGTVTNRAGPANVTVAGSILNRGNLRTHPESEDLAVRLGGDLVSEGPWSPGETYFEEGVHALRLASGRSLGGSVRGSSRGVTIRAASPLAFDGPVRITELDMAGHRLSIRGPLSAGVRGATTIAGAGAAELTRVAVEGDARLEGALKVRRLTVSGDLETDAEIVNAASYSSLAVQGSLTNGGRIGLDPDGGPFDIKIAAALDNRGWIDERLLPRVPLEDPTGGRPMPTPTAPEGGQARSGDLPVAPSEDKRVENPRDTPTPTPPPSENPGVTDRTPLHPADPSHPAAETGSGARPGPAMLRVDLEDPQFRGDVCLEDPSGSIELRSWAVHLEPPIQDRRGRPIRRGVASRPSGDEVLLEGTLLYLPVLSDRPLTVTVAQRTLGDRPGALGVRDRAFRGSVSVPTTSTCDGRSGPCHSVGISDLPVVEPRYADDTSRELLSCRAYALAGPDSGDLTPGVREPRTPEVEPPPARFRYRLAWNGFEVVRATEDDPLQFDGKGDEVYLSAALFTVREGEGVPPPEIVKSRVMGDVNGYPARAAAGSASPQGGLVVGDRFPENPASLTTATNGDVPPMLLFDGEVRSGLDFVVVAPVLWERDGSSAAYDGWVEWARTDLRGHIEEYRSEYLSCTPSGRIFWRPPVGDFTQTYADDSWNRFDRPIGKDATTVGDSHFVLHSHDVYPVPPTRGFLNFDLCQFPPWSPILELRIFGGEEYRLYFQLNHLGTSSG